MAGSRLGNFLARPLSMFLMAAAALVVFDRCTGANYTANSYSACPAISPGALSLPPDKQSHWQDFERQALLLNARGECVLEGSWGQQTGTFYIVVQAKGSQPRHVRFTADDLTR